MVRVVPLPRSLVEVLATLVWIYLDQTRCPFQRAAFGQMFTDSDGFGFSHLRVSQRGLLALTEFAATRTAAQVANLNLMWFRGSNPKVNSLQFE
jgi:hypothetical protein